MTSLLSTRVIGIDDIGRTLLTRGEDSTSSPNPEATAPGDGLSEGNLPDYKSPSRKKYLERIALRNLTGMLVSTSCMLSLYG